jgi:molybdopterin synthase sulfur carrier subunit
MPITIEIPTAFRRFTDGNPRVDCTGATIAEALNELTTRFPDLSRHVRDDSGQIRQFLNVYLIEEDIRFLGGESCCLKEGDRVLLVPSIAGGCEPHPPRRAVIEVVLHQRLRPKY